jgi:hypothetical protein
MAPYKGAHYLICLQDYTRHSTKDHDLKNHYCENLKTYKKINFYTRVSLTVCAITTNLLIYNCNMFQLFAGFIHHSNINGWKEGITVYHTKRLPNSV